MNEEEIEKIKFAVRASKDSLVSFSEYINEKYEAEWFHEEISHILEGVLKDTMEKNLSRRIIITVPPRCGKTQLASINFSAWALGKYKSLPIIVSTYGAELSEDIGQKTRDIISNPVYQAIFPSVKMRKDTRGKTNFKLSHLKEDGTSNPNYDSSFYAVGLGGPVTGKGFKILMIDDIVKDRASAESQAYQKQVWDYYRSTLYSRMEGTSAIIVIMQRWNQNDLVARLLEEDDRRASAGESVEGWQIINFPFIAEEDEYSKIDNRLLRKKNELIYPKKFNWDFINNIKSTSLYYYASQYQQNPILKETAEFKEEMFKYYEPDDLKYKNLRYFTLVDPAISQKKSADNAVVLTVAKEVDGPNIYRLREDAGRYTPQQLIDLVFVHAKEFHSELWIETIAYQEALKYLIQERQQKTGQYFVIHEIRPRSAKETRIRGLLGMYQNGVIWHLKGKDSDYELELLAFPNGRRDDRIDCQAFIIIALEDIPLLGKAKVVIKQFYGYGKTRK